MKRFKNWLLLLFLSINLYSSAQLGYGIRAGILESVPLQNRDTFSGSPVFFAGINVYIPINEHLRLVTGLHFMPVKLSNNLDASGILWQNFGINIGTEWNPEKLNKTSITAGLNTHYIFKYGRNQLSANTSSGTSFVEQKIKRRLMPSVEVGINFKPKPLVNLKFAIAQPLNIGKDAAMYKMPFHMTLGIEYRITSRDIKQWSKDTIDSQEELFCNNLRNGILFVILDQTDSSNRLIKTIMEEHYFFNKVKYIDLSKLSNTLDSLKNTSEPNVHFIAKIGSIVYLSGRPSTYGLIIYNHEMQNPIAGDPFFVRNLTNDVFFEDPLVVKKIIRTTNARLFKLCNGFKR